MRLRVVCGLGETIATLRPTRVLTSVDFPALGRPTIATKPDLNAMKLNCTPMSGRLGRFTPTRTRLHQRGRGARARARAAPCADWLRALQSERRPNQSPRPCAGRGPLPN